MRGDRGILSVKLRATELGPEHRQDIEALLRAEVENNLFLLGLLNEGGFDPGVQWMGVSSPTGRLEALTWIRMDSDGSRAMAVPAGSATGCHTIGQALGLEGPTTLVGPASPSDAFWAGMGRAQARFHFDQVLYSCVSVTPGPGLPLRQATEAELDLVSEMTGSMMKEDLGADPRRLNLEGHQARVLAQIRRGRALLAMRAGQPCFSIDLGTLCPDGAQVGGTWVPVDLRGAGLGTQGMRSTCRILLGTTRPADRGDSHLSHALSSACPVPRVTLHVRKANLTAIGCYERCGFQRIGAFRILHA